MNCFVTHLRHISNSAAMILIALFLASAGVGYAGEPNGVLLGLNTYLGNNDHSEIRGPTCVRATATDRTNYLDAVRDLGVKTVRETWSWAEMEPEPNKGCHFEAFDDLAQKASDRGIDIVALIYPVPDWASGAAPMRPGEIFKIMRELPRRQFEPEFRRFVRAVVSRYSGQTAQSLRLKLPIRKWIFSNEIDWTEANTPTNSPDSYAFWLKIFYEEVKAIDPGAIVAAMGFGNLKSDSFLPRLLASQNLKGPRYPYFDAMTIHIYPSLNVPVGQKGANDATAVFRRRMQEHNIHADLWVDETAHSNPDIAIQAVICAAATGVSRVNLHGLWDIPDWDGAVLANTPSGQIPVRKPLFFTYKTLLEKIGDNRGIKELSPGCYQVLLPTGKSVYVLWAAGSAKPTGDFLKGRIRVTNLSGKQEEMSGDQLVLTPRAVLVEPVAPQHTARARVLHRYRVPRCQ